MVAFSRLEMASTVSWSISALFAGNPTDCAVWVDSNISWYATEKSILNCAQFFVAVCLHLHILQLSLDIPVVKITFNTVFKTYTGE